MSENCPVCDTEIDEPKQDPRRHLVNHYSCPACGEFYLAKPQLSMGFKEHIQRVPHGPAILSHGIWKRQKAGKPPDLTRELIDRILENEPLPTLKEQADNLILLLAENLPGPGHSLRVSRQQCLSKIGAKDLPGVEFVLRGLFDKELLETPSMDTLSLTPRGWERYDELKCAISEAPKAFMAMKFGDKKLDRFCAECVKPAVEQTGFHLVRVDCEPKAGPIDTRIMVEIRAARFVVADLTEDNPGAYWEAGFAEGLGKPVFYTCLDSRKFSVMQRLVNRCDYWESVAFVELTALSNHLRNRINYI